MPRSLTPPPAWRLAEIQTWRINEHSLLTEATSLPSTRPSWGEQEEPGNVPNKPVTGSEHEGSPPFPLQPPSLLCLDHCVHSTTDRRRRPVGRLPSIPPPPQAGRKAAVSAPRPGPNELLGEKEARLPARMGAEARGKAGAGDGEVRSQKQGRAAGGRVGSLGKISQCGCDSDPGSRVRLKGGQGAEQPRHHRPG